MGLRIATNISSLAAQRSLTSNAQNYEKTLEHLSSGSRINKSADDAAGLAIAEKLKAAIRGLKQDERNAQDGIAMIQTAEGSMNEIGNILIRLRELSMQAASDTVGQPERAFVDKEFQQLSQEIERISESTEFNGRKLLTGDEVLDIQVGLHNRPDIDRFQFDVARSRTTREGLGVTGLGVSTKEGAQESLKPLDSAIHTLAEKRAELGSLQNRLQSGIDNLLVYHENLSAARSRIWDADMASETAEATKGKILAEATTSVLTQANQSASLALKLLQ